MKAADHDQEIAELAEELYSLYTRFGEPDSVSLLDRGIRFSWSAATPSLARYAQIPMDTELLHYTCWPPGSGGKINLYLHGDDALIKGAWNKIWPRVYDMASARKRS